MDNADAQITGLLSKSAQGDSEAMNQVIPLVYARLRKIAEQQMRRESSGHTLTPTALVHEAFLRLQQSKEFSARDRGHFYSVASRCMRHLIIDYARAKKSEKRGGKSAVRVMFDERFHFFESNGIDITLLGDLLEKLEARDPRLGQIIEFHFLMGLTLEEVAAALNVSLSTIKRDVQVAKMWLQREMGIPQRRTG